MKWIQPQMRKKKHRENQYLDGGFQHSYIQKHTDISRTNNWVARDMILCRDALVDLDCPTD